jgi:hypothetical protein
LTATDGRVGITEYNGLKGERLAEYDKFGAAGPAAGYYYQARLALAEALRFAYADSGIEIAIEKLDDVSFESDGTPLELIQSKHHIGKIADLTDHSADLWKTLRIWSVRVKHDPSLPSRTRFALVTTAAASTDSAAASLRSLSSGSLRDIQGAMARLIKVTQESTNKALQSSFTEFLSLAPEMQASLVNAIEVFDSSPSVLDLAAVIEERLKMIAPRGKTKLAREHLEGWWWPRICKALLEPDVGKISILELEARLDDIREVMKRDALPVQMDSAEVDEQALEALDEMTFVRQLQLIKLGQARVEFAKRDFYRASTQRSRWTRENLLFDGEVSAFERTLIEEWQPRFHAMCDTLGRAAAAATIRKAGIALYQWVENEARFPFRTMSHRFLSVGSFHMLANDIRIGWHRDYEEKLTLSGKK